MRYTDLFESQAVPFNQLPNYEELVNPLSGVFNIIGMPGNKGLVNSLEGCPAKITRSFTIRNQPELHSLEFGPKKVTADFGIFYTGLTSLHHCPEVLGRLHIADNKYLTSLDGCHPGIKELAIYGTAITSLKGCPSEVTEFSIKEASITNLSGGPNVVNGIYSAYADLPNLVSYEGAPKDITGDCIIKALQSMSNFDTYFPLIKGELSIEIGDDIPAKMLSILRVAGLKRITFTRHSGLVRDLTDIFNEHYGQGIKGISKCQMALIKAGYQKAAGL